MQEHGAGTPSEFTTALRSAVKAVIVRSYFAMGRGERMPSDEIMDATAEEVTTALDQTLPIERLDEVYELAMAGKTDTFELGAPHLNAAWRQIRGDEFKPKRASCFGCQAAEDDPDGRLVCPYHNSKRGENVNS
jgi:hypothetical protein